jgi:hypothetical protein
VNLALQLQFSAVIRAVYWNDLCVCVCVCGGMCACVFFVCLFVFSYDICRMYIGSICLILILQLLCISVAAVLKKYLEV